MVLRKQLPTYTLWGPSNCFRIQLSWASPAVDGNYILDITVPDRLQEANDAMVRSHSPQRANASPKTSSFSPWCSASFLPPPCCVTFVLSSRSISLAYRQSASDEEPAYRGPWLDARRTSPAIFVWLCATIHRIRPPYGSRTFALR